MSLLRDEMSVVVVTNDIFTSEDAKALREAAVLPVAADAADAAMVMAIGHDLPSAMNLLATLSPGFE